jgi:hypothetical protein
LCLRPPPPPTHSLGRDKQRLSCIFVPMINYFSLLSTFIISGVGRGFPQPEVL